MTEHTGNFHRKGYLMLHHLAGATIQVANLVNYCCRPLRGWQHRNNVRDYLNNSILPYYNLQSSGIFDNNITAFDKFVPTCFEQATIHKSMHNTQC